NLLQGQQGFLILKASEAGADVEIDGRIVGVTPLARQTLSGGPHTLKLIKKGFVTWAKDVDIEKDQPAVIDASLVPSLEFINGYDDRANTWRVLAYITGGVGIAAIGFGVGGWMWNGTRATDYENELRDANCQKGATGIPTDCSGFDSRSNDIKGFDVITQVVGWVGVASLAVGTYLFFRGPQPGIYDQYKPEASVAAFNIVPVQDGVVATGTWQF
ncbi:PEGA domain-containing protein, partial [Myxococcota bacterium]